MPFSKQDRVFLALTAFAAFVGVILAQRGGSDAARLARAERKPDANAQEAGTGSVFSISGDIVDLIRRGKKSEAVSLYQEQNPGTELLAAKVIELIEQTGMQASLFPKHSP